MKILKKVAKGILRTSLSLGMIIPSQAGAVGSTKHPPMVYIVEQKLPNKVYITKKGSCFHKKGCRYLKNSHICVGKNIAIKGNFRPCKKCFLANHHK